METLKHHKGIIAPLDRANVDTDQIIPKQFLKSISRLGFGEGLFFDWRYLDGNRPDPSFELNQKRYQGASLLVTRNNFGCGSSREHAVWALAQYGFRVIIAPRKRTGAMRVPGFADIFRNNCVKNSILTVELDETEVDTIFKAISDHPGVHATADVGSQTLTLHAPEILTFSFEIEKSVQSRLMQGLDDIDLTLQKIDAISMFEVKHNSQIV